MKKIYILLLVCAACCSCKLSSDDNSAYRDKYAIAGFSDNLMENYVDWTVRAIGGSKTLDNYLSLSEDQKNKSRLKDYIQESSNEYNTYYFDGIGRYIKMNNGWAVYSNRYSLTTRVMVTKKNDSTFVATVIPSNAEKQYSLDMTVDAVFHSDPFLGDWTVNVTGERTEDGGYIANFSTKDMGFSETISLYTTYQGYSHKGVFNLTISKNDDVLSTCKAVYFGGSASVIYYTSEGDI
jgi:hypothetical protein